MGPAFRRLLPFVLRYRRQYITGLACVVMTSAIQLLSPWILKYAIDDITRGITRQKLALYAGLLLGVACLGAGFRFLMRRTGDLMSRATNDLNAVRMMIGPSVMYSANTILMFTVAIVIMLSIDARLTLIALLPLPLVSVTVWYFGSAIHKRFEAIQAQLSDMSAVVQEA